LEVGQLPTPSLHKNQLENLIRLYTPTTPVALVVMLFDVKDPMNVGTLLRTCYFFGVRDVFLTERW